MNACRNVYNRFPCICTYIRGYKLITGFGQILLPRADLGWYLPRKYEKSCSTIRSIGTLGVILTAHTWLKLWNGVDQHTHKDTHTGIHMWTYIYVLISIYICIYILVENKHHLQNGRQPFPEKRHFSGSKKKFSILSRHACVPGQWIARENRFGMCM